MTRLEMHNAYLIRFEQRTQQEPVWIFVDGNQQKLVGRAILVALQETAALVKIGPK